MTSSPPRGHIKLARKAFDPHHGDPWWLERRTFSKWEAWVDLLQLAQYQPFRHVTKYGVVDLQRGEFVASLRWLGERWGWSTARVLRCLRDAEKSHRIAKQREERAGVVYLIVKYDAYQSNRVPDETPAETVAATVAKQSRNKNKQIKQIKQKTPSDAPASEVAPLDVLPKPVVDAAYERWVARMGACNYGLLRKGLLPVYRSAEAAHPTAAELVAAVEAFADARSSQPVQFRDRWHERKFAAELPEWVRYGAMPLVDEWGLPTERGIATGALAA